MTTYDRPTRTRVADEELILRANRLQWRGAESEWLRAEDALREFMEYFATHPIELRGERCETGERLRLRRDEARNRVIELDQAYAAAWEGTSREESEGLAVAPVGAPRAESPAATIRMHCSRLLALAWRVTRGSGRELGEI